MEPFARLAKPDVKASVVPRYSMALLLTLSSCTTSPAQNIVGSFFPSWLLCAVLGVIVATALRQVLLLADLDSRLILPLLTYAAIAGAATLAIWLACFGD